MPSLISRAMQIKPLPPTTQHEYWCEDCSFGYRASAHPTGSPEDIAAEFEARRAVLAHKGECPDHHPHTRMHARNIDTTPDFELGS